LVERVRRLQLSGLLSMENFKFLINFLLKGYIYNFLKVILLLYGHCSNTIPNSIAIYTNAQTKTKQILNTGYVVFMTSKW